MYSDRTGTDKSHPVQNLPDKRSPDKTPGKTPLRTIETEFVQEAFVRVFVLGLLKIGVGGPSCVTYFRGDVWRSVTGGGGKNWPKIA